MQFVVAVLKDSEIDCLTAFFTGKQTINKSVDCLAHTARFLWIVFLIFEKMEIRGMMFRVHRCSCYQEMFGFECSNEGILC